MLFILTPDYYYNSQLLKTFSQTLSCLQGVPGEMEQVQPLLYGARGQKGGVQHPHHRVKSWGERTAGAKSTQTHQSGA